MAHVEVRQGGKWEISLSRSSPGQGGELEHENQKQKWGEEEWLVCFLASRCFH